jgi:cyclic pyranopterin phosphate synthase
MRNISSKTTTLRRARAVGCVRAAPESIRRLEANDLPKKDVLTVARVAAITAAKRTSDLIPYCHPLPIDSVDVDFAVSADRIDIAVTVTATWKTGVEMEALSAVSVAALTIYDMLKPIDTGLVIDAVKLEEKRGGKSDFARRVPPKFSAAVIVTSDDTHAGRREDKSGRIIVERLKAYGIEPDYGVLPDEEALISQKLRDLVERDVDLVLTTGGTGLGPRDVTVEATRRVIEREVPGIVEAARAFGQSRTPYAMLSRGVAGVARRTLIVNLPGSSTGADETMCAIFPAILHAHGILRGGGH